MNRTTISLFWQFIDRFSVQGIQFLIGIVLSRLLSPNDYGIIGIIMVFFTFCDIFVDSGFGKGLIQKTDRTDIDSSTVFFFNIVVSLCCMTILWVTAPFIADFYENQNLVLLLRVSSFTLLLNALSVVQMSHLIASFSFRSLAKANFLSTFLSGVLAIVLALNRMGVWALVCQYLFRSLILFFVVWFSTRWVPKIVFSKSSFKELYSYSSKIFLGTFVNQIVSNINNIFIAKQLSVSSLGYYTRGQQFPSFIQGALSSIFSNVSLPLLAERKNDMFEFTSQARNFIKLVMTVTLPMMFLLALLSKPLVVILLTDKWLPCVPIIQIYCLIRLFQSNGIINLNCALAACRSDVPLKVELIKIPLGLLCLIISVKYGLYYFVLGQCILAFINLFIDSHFTGHYINYGILSQIKDSISLFISGMIVAAFSSLFYLVIDNPYIQVIAISLSFCMGYFSILFFLKNKELLYFLKYIKNR